MDRKLLTVVEAVGLTVFLKFYGIFTTVGVILFSIIVAIDFHLFMEE